MVKKSCFFYFFDYTTFTSIEEDNTLTVITILFCIFLFIIFIIMKCISKVGIIDDDIAVAELNTGETVQLYMIHKNDQTYYKIKIDNILCPVGTPKSGVMFTEFTRFFYS